MEVPCGLRVLLICLFEDGGGARGLQRGARQWGTGVGGTGEQLFTDRFGSVPVVYQPGQLCKGPGNDHRAKGGGLPGSVRPLPTGVQNVGNWDASEGWEGGGPAGVGSGWEGAVLSSFHLLTL